LSQTEKSARDDKDIENLDQTEEEKFSNVINIFKNEEEQKEL